MAGNVLEVHCRSRSGNNTGSRHRNKESGFGFRDRACFESSSDAPMGAPRCKAEQDISGTRRTRTSAARRATSEAPDGSSILINHGAIMATNGRPGPCYRCRACTAWSERFIDALRRATDRPGPLHGPWAPQRQHQQSQHVVTEQRNANVRLWRRIAAKSSNSEPAHCARHETYGMLRYPPPASRRACGSFGHLKLSL